jgi:hypothetical protein
MAILIDAFVVLSISAIPRRLQLIRSMLCIKIAALKGIEI